MIHYKVLALNEDGSLKLEPVDLDVGSSFDASSSYRNFFLFTILPQFSSQLLQQKPLTFCSAYRKYLSADILEELKTSFAINRMSSHKYSCISFIDRRNFKAAENSSSSLAAEATEVSIREYLKYILNASKQAPENISQNQTTVYFQGPS